MQTYDVVILGAGAAGLFAAALIARQGLRVCVLESSNKPGKKILMSGGGRCNFTNLVVEPEHYLSANPHFCKSALKRFTQWGFIQWVEQHRIPYHDKGQGQLFCDHSAKDLLAALLDDCEQAAVTLQTKAKVTQVQTTELGFRLQTATQRYAASRLLVATGGLSVPTLGGSGFGYRLAQQFGHALQPTQAGLVPLTLTDHWHGIAQSLSGISLAVTASCGQMSFSDQMLFTHRGLSGPAILQISSYWQPGDTLQLDLLPLCSAAELLLGLKQQQPHWRVSQVLNAYWAKKLTQALEGQWWPDLVDQPLANISDARLQQLAQQIKQWILKPAASEGYRTAEVTLGGVDTEHVSSKTLESRLQPGAYFVGEVLDVTGHLGGYNFQWAWSSAYAAAQAIIASLR